MTANRAVLLIILFATFVRSGLAAIFGLGFDESYMAGNARVFALGYFDHPPLHVWMAWAAERLSGRESSIVLRLPFIALFGGSTWLMYRLAATLFGERAGLWSAGLLNLTPVFTIPHGSWILPDGPLIFFLLATMLALSRLFFVEPLPKDPVIWWLGAGALGGLALLSKFTAVFLFFGVFAFLISTRARRRCLATPGPWLGAAVALIVFSPALIWNAEHRFVSITFQAQRLTPAAGIRPDWLIQDVGGQVLYLSPAVFLLVAYAVSRALRQGPAASKSWLLAMVAIGPIVVFTTAALWSRGLPHWPMPGWLMAVPLGGQLLATWSEGRPALIRGIALGHIGLLAVVVVALAAQVQTGWINRAAPRLVAAKDPTLDLMDWSELRGALESRRLLVPNVLLAGPHWMWAGKIFYALGSTQTVLCLCTSPRQFAFRADLRQFVGRDVIIAAPEEEMNKEVRRLADYFDSTEPLSPITLMRGGVPAIKLALFRGHGLHRE